MRLNYLTRCAITRNDNVVSLTSGTKWHLTGIEKFVSSWRLFSIVIATASVTMLSPSNGISVSQ